jgi:hypothetical protein
LQRWFQPVSIHRRIPRAIYRKLNKFLNRLIHIPAPLSQTSCRCEKRHLSIFVAASKLGWLSFDITVFKSIIPGFTSMKVPHEGRIPPLPNGASPLHLQQVNTFAVMSPPKLENYVPLW